VVTNAIADQGGHYLPVRTPDDFRRARHSDRVGIIPPPKPRPCLTGLVEWIPYFHDLGVRSMQLSFNYHPRSLRV